MTVFLIIGSVGLLLVLASLILGELFDGLLGGIGDGLDAGGVVSGPVIGAFFAAFGFGGALILSSVTDSVGLAALGGLLCGLAMGGAAWGITKSLVAMPTDATFKTENLIGTTATVITPVPEHAMGEVSVSYGGQVLKLGARASVAIASGTQVTITAVTSSSSVVVAPVTPPPE